MNKNSLFGKAVEHYIISLMCRKGLDCYVPVNDDKGIDVIVRGESGKTVPVQIKSTSPDIKVGDAGFFVVKKNQTAHDNCFFVFYSARMNEIWLMTKDELSSFGSINTKGKHIGDISIRFNGTKKGAEYVFPQFAQFAAGDFSRLAEAVK